MASRREWGDYYGRFWRRTWRLFWRKGVGQLIGLLLAVATLVIQIKTGMISPDMTLGSWASVAIPYAIYFAGLVLWCMSGAPVELDEERKKELTEASEKLTKARSRVGELEAAEAEPQPSPIEQSWYDRIAAACDGCSDEALGLLSSLVGGALPDYVCQSEELHEEFKGIREKLSDTVEYQQVERRKHRYVMHEKYQPILERYINARLAADPPSSTHDP